MSKSTSTKIVRALGIFVAGALLGAGVGIWWTTESFRIANEYATLNAAASEGEAALEPYLFSRPEVAVYALERYVAFLQRERGRNLKLLDAKTIDMDLSLATARLGSSQEKLGKTKEALALYEESRASFARAGREIGSVDELKRTLDRLDQKVRENWSHKPTR